MPAKPRTRGGVAGQQIERRRARAGTARRGRAKDDLPEQLRACRQAITAAQDALKRILREDLEGGLRALAEAPTR